MQSVTDLIKLRDAIRSRVLRLRGVASSISSPLGAEENRAISYVTIEIDNLVVFGLRQYAKSCLLGGRASNGLRITSTVRPKTTEEAAAYIYKSVNPAGYQNIKSPKSIRERDEIIVRDPKKIEKVLMDYSVSNISTFTIALSLNAEVFHEAKICRHFFAHRTRNTFEAVTSFASGLGVVGVEMPEHLVVRGRPGTGVRFLDGWLSDVDNFFDLAT